MLYVSFRGDISALNTITFPTVRNSGCPYCSACTTTLHQLIDIIFRAIFASKITGYQWCSDRPDWRVYRVWWSLDTMILTMSADCRTESPGSMKKPVLPCGACRSHLNHHTHAATPVARWFEKIRIILITPPTVSIDSSDSVTTTLSSTCSKSEKHGSTQTHKFVHLLESTAKREAAYASIVSA